jgi:hypothetical protein
MSPEAIECYQKESILSALSGVDLNFSLMSLEINEYLSFSATTIFIATETLLIDSANT